MPWDDIRRYLNIMCQHSDDHGDDSRSPDRSTYWRHPFLDGVELMRAHFVRHRFALHTHDFYGLGMIESGVHAFRHQRQVHTTGPGSVIAVNPGEPHDGYAAVSQGYRYRMLYVPAAVLYRTLAQEGETAPAAFFVIPAAQDPWLAERLHQLHTALERPLACLTADRLAIDSLWTQAMIALTRRQAEVTRQRPMRAATALALRLRDYLHDRMADSVSLEDLSRIADLSAFQTLRLFQRSFGLPPHAYLNQVRLARARTLLDCGLPAAEAAVAVGFADQSHLIRRFKAVHGITPRQYVLASQTGCKNVQ